MSSVLTTAMDTDLLAGLQARSDEAWPFYDADEVQAVVEVLRSGRVNQWTGDHVFAFEEACDQRFGGGRGIALTNGSVALELALRAFGIGPGDEVIVTPRTFVASAFCVRLVGATPIFADVDEQSGNITAASIEACLTDRTRAVIPVHLAGWPCDMPAICALAGRAGIRVIEDCAQAQGAAIAGRSVGSFGDAAAFSFCQDKIISTGGEGGYTSFRDPEHWQWAWSFKDHGKSWDKLKAPHVGTGFRWLHDQVGTNWRLTGMQAAIGLIQLRKLDNWKQARTRNASIWAEALREVPALRVPVPAPTYEHAYYKFYVYVPTSAAAERDEILRRAANEGIRLFSGSCSEVYREAAFDDLKQPHLPVARDLGQTSLMMEVHPTLRTDLTRRRADRVATIARELLR